MAFYLDPDDYLDFGFDYTAWLDGDTITASTWAIEPNDNTLTTSNPTFDPAGKTTIWLADGTPGVVYKVVNHITTAAGRQKTRSFKVTSREA